jgi:glycosyltransferase involved in cell wall biosynthesis
MHRLRILAFGPNRWKGQWWNRQHLLSRLGANHDILYSTGALSVWQRHLPEWQSARLFGRLERIDNVVVEEPPKLLLRWPKWPLIDRLAVRGHARRLRSCLGLRGSDPFAMIVFHPLFASYLEYLKPTTLAYHAYDLFEATPGWNETLHRLEDRLLSEADLVTTVTEAIAIRLESRVKRRILILPNGVDLEGFDKACVDGQILPADLSAIAGPRLGYVGTLHPQVDFGLVAILAQRRPNWNFVFVGNRPKQDDERAEEELARCRALRNVHFLGEKTRQDVPAYLLGMDVNLMLYRVADPTWIQAGYPLKLHEYLAAGKPIVSADLVALRPFQRVLRIASGTDDWLSAIEQALVQGGPGTTTERRAIARENGWGRRVELLNTWLLESWTNNTQHQPVTTQSAERA